MKRPQQGPSREYMPQRQDTKPYASTPTDMMQSIAASSHTAQSVVRFGIFTRVLRDAERVARERQSSHPRPKGKGGGACPCAASPLPGRRLIARLIGAAKGGDLWRSKRPVLQANGRARVVRVWTHGRSLRGRERTLVAHARAARAVVWLELSRRVLAQIVARRDASLFEKVSLVSCCCRRSGAWVDGTTWSRACRDHVRGCLHSRRMPTPFTAHFGATCRRLGSMGGVGVGGAGACCATSYTPLEFLRTSGLTSLSAQLFLDSGCIHQRNLELTKASSRSPR